MITFSNIKKTFLNNIKKSSDEAIQKYFIGIINILEKESTSIHVQSLQHLSKSDPEFMNLRYCIYCGRIMTKGHNCSELYYK